MARALMPVRVTSLVRMHCHGSACSMAYVVLDTSAQCAFGHVALHGSMWYSRRGAHLSPTSFQVPYADMLNMAALAVVVVECSLDACAEHDGGKGLSRAQPKG